MIASLHRCADHMRNQDFLNIEGVITFIVNDSQSRKMFLIHDDFENPAFHTIEEAELYLEKHDLDLEIIAVNVK